jgi:hypothetical protein
MPIKRRRRAVSIAVGFMMLSTVVLVILPGSTLAQDNILTATRTYYYIAIDGVADDVGWEYTIPYPISVELMSEVKTVEMKALYDEEYLYMSLSWSDTSRSVTPQQWRYTAGEWLSIPNEEDRAALLWNTEDAINGFEQNKQGCVAACHDDVFRTDHSEERGDLWQWMAGRTNPSTRVPDVGWMDDLSLTDIGIMTDEDTGSAVWDVNSFYAHDDNASTVPFSAGDEPKWKEGITPPNPDPEGNFLFRDFDTFIEDLNDFEDGAILPGYRLGRPVDGQDRADIQAKGTYDVDEKIWTLEIQRKLVTGNEGDVSFDDMLDDYDFGISIFDNQDGGVETHYQSELVTLVFELPELMVFGVDVDPSLLIIGWTVNVTTMVKNMGGYSDGFTVAMYLDDIASEAVASTSLDEMYDDTEKSAKITWDIPRVAPGEYTLIIKVDADDIIDEYDENNNLLALDVRIYEDLPDLTIPEDGVSFIPEKPRIGETFNISVPVQNIGSNASGTTIVELYLLEGDNRSIASTTLNSMIAGESRTLEIPWPVNETNPVDDFLLGVRVDHAESVKELNEANNDVVVLVKILIPELDNLRITSSHNEVEEGEEVTINVSVNATGEHPGRITIVIYDGGTKVGTRKDLTVPAGGGVSEVFKIKMDGKGDHKINATLYMGTVLAKDPDGNEMVDHVIVTVTEASDDGVGMVIMIGLIIGIVLVIAIIIYTIMQRR